uniref:ABC transporter permease n=1 Tax=Anaerolinea thermolimosa TaxID=229919 RepID=A0A7C4KG24_9CHLR
MRLFLHLVKLSILEQATYRTALVAGLVTNFFWGLFRAAVIVALYNGRSEVNGLTLEGAITYIAVGQVMIAFLSLFGTFELMATVYSGSIASDLIRPTPLFFLWMARDLGHSLVNLVIRGALLLGVFALFYPIALPETPLGWGWTTLSLIIGWLVSYAWRFLVNLAAFWTPDARGIGRGAFALSQLASGFIIPLRLYPEWFSHLCYLTPFPAMFNTGMEVYLGALSGGQLVRALGVQLIWFLGLVLLSQWILRAGIRRLVIQGG